MTLPIPRSFDYLDLYLYQSNVPTELRQIILQYHGFVMHPKHLSLAQIEYAMKMFNYNFKKNIFIVVKLNNFSDFYEKCQPNIVRSARYSDNVCFMLGFSFNLYMEATFYYNTNYLCIDHLQNYPSLMLVETMLDFLYSQDEKLIIIMYRISSTNFRLK
jgi:hypothetical protein